jgi:alanyl-tRNA synthetase
VTAIVSGGAEQHELREGATGALVFDRTPFYAESGGQAGDHGLIKFANGAEFVVEDTQKQAGALHAHVGRLVKGAIKVGDKAKLEIDHERRAKIRSNHSATHLLHAALRNTLGPHVTQKGSLVEADYFRFDFSHGQALTADEIGRVEDEVNAVIRQNAEGVIKEMAPAKAIEEGALALFGEKYGDTVRVLRLGDALSERWQGVFGRTLRRHAREAHRRHRRVCDHERRRRRCRHSPHRRRDGRGSARASQGASGVGEGDRVEHQSAAVGSDRARVAIGG